MRPQDLDEKYWENRYQKKETGWDIGKVSPPLKEYIDQLQDKSLSILIPGCGFGYEAEYLYKLGFKNVFPADISPSAKSAFFSRCPEFPKENWISTPFFELKSHYNLILEQTFFCALHPRQRPAYVDKMADLLKPGGKLVGLLFDDQLNSDHPPFGGNKDEYIRLFSEKFALKTLEKAYNSIPPRANREFFIQFILK